MLIEIEGADGSGKSTLAKSLAEHLSCDVQRFPDYETVAGPFIRAYLGGRWSVTSTGDEETSFEDFDDRASAISLQALQTCNRIERIDVLRPFVGAPNSFLVLDRYHSSSVVYGQLDGLDPAWVEGLCAVLPKPDMHLLVDVPPEVALYRQGERRGEPSIYEGKIDRAKKLRDLYVERWVERSLESERREDRWKWAALDGSQTKDAVLTAALVAIVRRRNELTKRRT